MAKENVAALALDDTGGAAITCPHCGAPVKYSAPVSEQSDPQSAVMDMDSEEGAGEGDTLIPDAPLGDQLDAGNSGEEELMEKSTGSTGSAGTKEVIEKTSSMEASEDVAADDTVATDEDAALDEEAALDEGASQPQVPSPDGAKPKQSSAAPARPAPAANMNVATLHEQNAQLAAELRQLREEASRLERENAVHEQRERVRQARSLLQRGLKEGKLTPKQIGTPQEPTITRQFALRDPAGFAQWLEKEAPVVVDYAERGTSVVVENAGAYGLAEQVDKMARERMTANPSLDYKNATLRVLSENPRLQQQYDQEMSAAGPREITATSNNSNVGNRTA